MKHLFLLVLFCIGTVFTTVDAQTVDRKKYPDYSSKINPDYSLLINGNSKKGKMSKATDNSPLPDHVDNSRTKFFPPVFNQDGGSCGSASRICYMLTHELNAYRNADAQLLSNRYPSHFVWLLTRSSSGKNEFVTNIGVPSAEVYGGTTYSSLFGYQEDTYPDYGWMQGYDKWYSAMFNRAYDPVNFPVSVGTEEGRQAVKRWLYNHNGDNDFHAGGIAGIGVASGGDWQHIPSSKINDEIGATGMYFVNKWGVGVDHALTIVGYDDRIEFDLNHNGILGEKEADEKGAWIIVNSWSDGWCNRGFIYCPYAYAGSRFNEDGTFSKDWWHPEIYKIRKDYRPKRTLKVKMEYSRRSEICLKVGVSSNLASYYPEKTITLDHFNYSGDGNNGNTKPAPEVPMLGKWADGKMHSEPMEFGYDLTELSSGFDQNLPLKYFFTVETRDWAEGEGQIHSVSIIDYDESGITRERTENLWDSMTNQGKYIRNKGGRTTVSLILDGDGYYAPRNLTLSGNALLWDTPINTCYKLTGYRIYCNDIALADIEGNNTTYTLSEVKDNTKYSVSAIYEDGTESFKISVNSPIVIPTLNQITNFMHSGFSIPNVFSNKYEQATIEFWINPNSICDWNQTAGPGWGTFMFHANNNGAITAGWSTGAHRATTSGGKLKVNTWTHVAVTVNKNTLKIYVNGIESAKVTSDAYSGLGGFGNLVFRPSSDRDNADAKFDEIRIWNYERSAEQINGNKNVEFSGTLLPKGLIAYYKGDVISEDGTSKLHEYINGNHAEILNTNFRRATDTRLRFHNGPAKQMELEIIHPDKLDNYMECNVPISIGSKHSDDIARMVWNANDGSIKNLEIENPSITFKTPGTKTVTVVGYNANGDSIVKSCEFEIKEAQVPTAIVYKSVDYVSAGQDVTFINPENRLGYTFEWDLEGSEVPTATTRFVTTRYPKSGRYFAKLTITDPTGKISKTDNLAFIVYDVAPKADFEITPAVAVKGNTVQLKDKSKYSPEKWKWLLHSANHNIIYNGQNASLTPEQPGIYDVTLTSENGIGSDKLTRKRALVVCNADSKNGLNFSNSKAQVTLKQIPFTGNMHEATIDWWMNANKPYNYCNGFGEKDVLECKVSAIGSLIFNINGEKAESKPDFVITGEWHHYAVSFKYGVVKFYRDSKLISSMRSNVSSLPGTLKEFCIGLPNAPMNSQIDEFRIWNSALIEGELKQFANNPITDVAKAVSEHKLAVYYDFNQNSGDVIDRTDNHNDGIRTNFGPDGDAWGKSKGVFCLNLDPKAANKNITGKYLKNYKKGFKRDGNKLVNSNQSPRFGAIADWTLENATVANGITSGVHVDNNKGGAFTYTSGWDGFGDISNHKAYQTVTLPAGCYEFSAVYDVESQCGNSYVVVAQGKGLPNTSNINDAIASKAMRPKNSESDRTTVFFTLSKETEISLGLVINLPGQQCCTFNEFILEKVNAEEIDGEDNNGNKLLSIDESLVNTLYLPYASIVPENLTIYVPKFEESWTIEPVTPGNLLPANTGVIVVGDPGVYAFRPSTESGSLQSPMTGVNEDTEANPDKRYYEYRKEPEAGFYLYRENILKANRAYLVTDKSETRDFIKTNDVTTGIEDVEIDVNDSSNVIYDLNGFRISKPVKGNIYIINGKKVYMR